MIRFGRYAMKAGFVLLFLVGAIVNLVAHGSVAPLFVFMIMLAAALGAVRLLGKDVSQERTAILIMFVVCWFWAGVSASYLAIVGYENPDSWMFYDLVTDLDFDPIEEGEDVQWQTDDISVGKLFYEWFSVVATQNAGVIVVWRWTYRFFSALHLGNGNYIGVTTNILFVAMSVAMGMRMLKAMFGADPVRIRRYTTLCATCGIFWLFAALHVRDSMALFCVTLLAMFWVFYLQTPNIKNLVALLSATVIGFVVFGLIRTEFLFVPFAMMLAGSAAKIVGSRGDDRRRVWLYAGVTTFFLFALIGALLAFPALLDTIILLLERREQAYADVSAMEGAGSLGNQLIVGQTGILRLMFATPYLLLAPIPVWIGFFSDLSYHLYKTFHTLFMYLVLPLAAVAIWRMAKDRKLQSAPLLFITMSFAGFAMAIAYTSMEMRHLGAFFILFILLALVPDLRIDADRRMYRFGFGLLMTFVVPMHLTWVLYKAFT